MSRKFLHLLLEIILIIIVVIVSALITNELRADKIPLVPYYVTDTFYHTMSLNDFLQGEKKNLQVVMFDARTHALYKKDHVTAAKNFPVSEFDFFTTYESVARTFSFEQFKKCGSKLLR